MLVRNQLSKPHGLKRLRTDSRTNEPVPPCPPVVSTVRPLCSAILRSTKSRRSALIRRPAGLVAPNDGAITDDVRRKNGCESTLDPLYAQHFIPRIIGLSCRRSSDCVQRVLSLGPNYSTALLCEPALSRLNHSCPPNRADTTGAATGSKAHEDCRKVERRLWARLGDLR